MRFTIPQFIEHEAKIVGPLTFKQFVYFGLTGAVLFVIYFSASFTVFIISCIVLGGGALAFAFLRIGGRPLSTILTNFLTFNVSPKMYIWHKKDTPIQVFKKESPAPAEKPEEETPLKVAGKSQLQKLQTKIETRIK